jgi:hypothetical protein
MNLLGRAVAGRGAGPRRAVAALAGLAVAASSPVPPAASTWRRDIEERGGRELPEVAGMTET